MVIIIIIYYNKSVTLHNQSLEEIFSSSADRLKYCATEFYVGKKFQIVFLDFLIYDIFLHKNENNNSPFLIHYS